MGTKIDLTGQHFGKLTVLYEIPERKNKRIYWKCKCECGNECNIRGDLLRNGNTISCGCLKEINLIGQKFGKLIVLEKAESKNKRGYWKCQCECGNICYIMTNNLTAGKSQSCGCSNKEILKQYNTQFDLTDQKFGKLTVIKDSGERLSNKRILWLCQCDCGNICKVTGDNLKSGHTKSCGCIKFSYGEYLIGKILKENNISFKQEKTFNNCRFKDTNRPAKFDFYVNNEYIIEYDGSQHFEAKESGWDTQDKLIKTQEHDKIKNQWCKENNIPLIRIPYWHLNKLCLEDLLLEITQFIVI